MKENKPSLVQTVTKPTKKKCTDFYSCLLTYNPDKKVLIYDVRSFSDSLKFY